MEASRRLVQLRPDDEVSFLSLSAAYQELDRPQESAEACLNALKLNPDCIPALEGLAIAYSCNSFFSSTIRRTIDNPKYHNPRIGLTRWKEYCNAFGYGHRLGVDIPNENGGNIPDTTAYDKEYRGQWNSCTMTGGGLGIGQDKMLVTPLQM